MPPNPSPRTAAEPRRTAEVARLQMARLVVEPEHPLPEVFRHLCEIAADTLESERVGIWLFTADGNALRCANLFEREKREHSHGVTLHVAEFPDYIRAVSQRRALAVELAQADPRVSELREGYLVPLGITSLLDAPIIQQGAIVGVVCHEHIGLPRDWTTEDRDFAMSVADSVTTKMKSSELLIAKSALQKCASLAPGGDRFEVVGRLAAGVAHDFKNLLTIVLGNATMIAIRADLPSETHNHAVQIEQAAERGAELIRELLEFGREPSGAPRVLNVPEVINAFRPLLEAAAGTRHTVKVTREVEVGRVLIDRSNLERAIMNLVLNARDAMSSGGSILIHTAIEQTTEIEGPPGAYVRIDVCDTGAGIAPSELSKMFLPFYTTKPAGKGTGLGLASVRRVLDRAGGFVRVESTAGIGTTMHVYLPRVSGER